MILNSITLILYINHVIWLSVLRNASQPFYGVIWFSQPGGNMGIYISL